MTSMQLNAEIYKTMGIIAEDESLLKQALKYLKKLAAKKKDESLMSEQEFHDNINEAIQQVKRGEVYVMNPGESLDDFLDRVN